MGPIEIGIDPVLFRFGHLALTWYGIFIVVGIFAAFSLATREAKRKGLGPDPVWTVGGWGLIGGFVGARLFHVVDNWPTYAANPGAILAFQNGGLAIWGAIVGGVAAGSFGAWRAGLPLRMMADVASPALVLGQAIGRLGCIVNGDSVGSPTSLPWGLVYTNPAAMAPQTGVAYQPTPIYEMLWDLLVLGILLFARRRLRADGQLFTLYIVLYAIGKFTVTFLRQEAIMFAGLQEAQLVSLGALIIAVPAFLLLGRRRPADRAMGRGRLVRRGV